MEEDHGLNLCLKADSTHLPLATPNSFVGPLDVLPNIIVCVFLKEIFQGLHLRAGRAGKRGRCRRQAQA